MITSFILNHYYLRLESPGGIKIALVPTLAFANFLYISLHGHTPEQTMVAEVCDPNHGRYQVTSSPISLMTENLVNHLESTMTD